VDVRELTPGDGNPRRSGAEHPLRQSAGDDLLAAIPFGTLPAGLTRRNTERCAESVMRELRRISSGA
jgi:hypothetical protein